MLLCLIVCLTLLASFFLPSHLSLKHVIVYFADFGSEVESETIGSHKGASLVGLPQHSTEGKVQSVCARVVLHDQTASILQHIPGAYHVCTDTRHVSCMHTYTARIMYAQIHGTYHVCTHTRHVSCMHTYKFIIIAQEVMATLKIGCLNVAKYINNDRNVGLQGVA